MSNLAEIIALSGAEFVALQEVENRRVLEDLTDLLATRYGHQLPHIVHREGPDHRGIDVALLAAFPPVSSNWFTPVEAQRDILSATFSPHGAELTILVNHWKSRWGGAEATAPDRMTQALAARAQVERLLAEDPLRAVVVMGDFNADIDAPPLRKGLRSTTSVAEFFTGDNWLLFNLHAWLPEEQHGTFYYHRGRSWNSLDSIHVTAGMLNPTAAAQWKAQPGSYEVIRWSRLLDPWGRPKAYRRVSNPDTGKRYYQYGYSDHLPVRVTLRLQSGGSEPLPEEPSPPAKQNHKRND